MASLRKARRRRVAVVGGGPAGLTAGRYLAEFGHTPVIFEAGEDVGGIWAPRPTNSVVYSSLVTNIPTMCMQSFDLNFPEGLPSYISASQLGSYFTRYADHFALRKYLRFGSRVIGVRPLESEEEEALGTSAWQITWSTGSGDEQSDHFDAVVVANGHYEFPYCPEIPGQAEWMAASPARKVLHSISYDDPSEFSGRSVLVVGGRSSGVDVARELRGKAAWVYVLEGSCKEVCSVGSCTNAPLGTVLGADGKLLFGGEELPGQPVDTIILATGYTYKFPFLDEESLGLQFGPARRYVEPLYQHIIHVRRPSLCFLGLPLAVPCPVALFEAQARFAAAHLSADWTDAEHRQRWVDARFQTVGERSQDFHFLGSRAWNYMRQLAQEAGMPEKDFETYSRRISLVQAIHEDRGSKRPELPWDDDWYRRCEYAADYEAGSFKVTLPDGTVQEGNAIP